ncbi:hypothetical protein WISP_112397 [Willisornis vidua]|uniref:Uncharacterized protein n=1 Tax=Willisornis vidua TaxID=1566151 RepID=A0ABQ9D0N9_9PASS|nr:hypothetical protein WISP_112397 [Willisornis vidua]
MILVENSSFLQDQSLDSHSHGPQVCDADNEQIVFPTNALLEAFLAGPWQCELQLSFDLANAIPDCSGSVSALLDLEKNNITRITKTDFTGLKNLRVLAQMVAISAHYSVVGILFSQATGTVCDVKQHLEENQISVIERGAFQDLKQLERL